MEEDTKKVFGKKRLDCSITRHIFNYYGNLKSLLYWIDILFVYVLGFSRKLGVCIQTEQLKVLVKLVPLPPGTNLGPVWVGDT